MQIQKPTIGRVVLYRTDGRNGLTYDLPAIITCTQDTHPGNYPDGRSNPLPVPSSPSHVHLTVLTPGGFGSVLMGDPPADDEDWVGAETETFTPGSGTYVEWDVPFDSEAVEYDEYDRQSLTAEPSPRTWRYPAHTNEKIEA